MPEETVELHVKSTAPDLKGLTATEAKLTAISTALGLVNAQMIALGTGSFLKKGAAGIGDILKGMPKGGSIKDISAVLGFDPDRVVAHISEMKAKTSKELKASLAERAKLTGDAAVKEQAKAEALQAKLNTFRSFKPSTQTFSANTGDAAKVLASFEDKLQKDAAALRKTALGTLANAVSGGGGGGGGTVAGGPVSLSGQVPLLVLAQQIAATVGPGPITLIVPAAQIQAAAGPGMPGAVGASGRGASERGEREKGGSSRVMPAPPKGAGTVTETITTRPEDASKPGKVVQRSIINARESLDRFFKEVDGVLEPIKNVEKVSGLKEQRAAFTKKFEGTLAELKAMETGNLGNPKKLIELKRKAAAQITEFVSGGQMAVLDGLGLQGLVLKGQKEAARQMGQARAIEIRMERDAMQARTAQGALKTTLEKAKLDGEKKFVADLSARHAKERSDQEGGFKQARVLEQSRLKGQADFVKGAKAADRTKRSDDERGFRLKSDLEKARLASEAQQRADLEKRQKDEIAEAKREGTARAKLDAVRQRTQAKGAKDAEAVAALERGEAVGAAGRRAAQARIADLGAQGFQVKRTSDKTEVEGKKRTRVEQVTATKEDKGQVLTEKFRLESVNGQATKSSLEQTQHALKATRAEAGAAGRDFLKNTQTVTAWAVSVATLYGGLAILRSGLSAVVQVGAQTARLGQVFRGVGGSAKDLVGDVLSLASANGRSTAEALDSAIAWSRFGFTRAEVNEAVRVSLMAANVAELEAGEATAKLSAIMAAYGLRVGELGPLLGQLNNVSNTYRVTNADMLEGLTRTASVARQAGIPLAELIGLIGGTVGKTGQTGANIGNALKSITVALSNPDLQQALREKFKFEVSVEGGNDIKNMSVILGEMFTKYQSLNAAMRQSFLFSVAGKTQANRLAALLDSYVQSQVLAINAQLNLNSAELENAKIKETLKAQLQGLVTEWEKFAATQAAGVPGAALSGMTQSLRTILGLANLPGVSEAVKGMIALMGLMALKMALTAVQMRTVAGSSGFIVNSMKSVAQAFAGLGQVMSASVQKFAATTTAGDVPLRGFIGSVNAWGVAASHATKGTMALTLGMRTLGIAARLSAFAMAAFVELVLPLLIVAGVIHLINKAWNAAGDAIEEADRKLAGFNDRAEAAAKASEAASKAAKLFDTVSKSLGEKGTRPEDRRRMIDVATTAAFRNPNRTADEARNKALAEELNTLMDQNKVIQAQQRLAEVSKQQRIEAMIQRGRELTELNNGQQHIRDQMEALEKQAPTAKNNALQEKLKKQADDNAEQKRAKILEHSQVDEDAYDKFKGSDMRHLISLEKQKLVLESIRDIYAEIPTLTASDKLGVDLAAKGAQLAQQIALIKELENAKPADKGKDTKDIDEMIKMGRASLREAKQRFESAEDIKDPSARARYQRNRGNMAELLGPDHTLHPYNMGWAPGVKAGALGKMPGMPPPEMMRAQERVEAAQAALMEKMNARRDIRTGTADPFFEEVTKRAQDSLDEARKARDKIQQELEALKALTDLKAKQDEIKMAFTRAKTGFGALEYGGAGAGQRSEVRGQRSGDDQKNAADLKSNLEHQQTVRANRDQELKALRDAGVSPGIIAAYREPHDKQEAELKAKEKAIRARPKAFAGETETERMLNKRKGLESIIAKPLSGSPAQQDDQRLTKLAAIQEFKDNELNIDKMRVELANREKQLLIDKNVELKKSLMLASPQDMLRKIAAAQITQGGKRQLSMGQFMAASPEFRKELQMQGQFDYDQQRLKKDREILGQRPDNPAFNKETNKFNEEEQRLRDQIAAMLKPATDKANAGIVEGLDPAIKQAWEKSMTAMATQATLTAQALGAIPKVVEQMVLNSLAAQAMAAGTPKGTRSQAENFAGKS